MSDECPDVIQNIKDAIKSVEDAYFNSQLDALKNIGEDLNTVNQIPPTIPPAQQTEIICATFGGALDSFNNLRNSCTFNPSGCLQQVLNSGVLDGAPVAAGAALAAAVFVDAATGEFQPPLQVPPPSLDIGITQPRIPGELNIPKLPEPPPLPGCQDPIRDLNLALGAAEETWNSLHKQVANGLTDSINNFVGDLGGLPTSIQANALCVGIDAGFGAAADIALGTCKIDIGQCLKQVLQSGILGGDPILAGAAFGAALFADGSAGNLPTIS